MNEQQYVSIMDKLEQVGEQLRGWQARAKQAAMVLELVCADRDLWRRRMEALEASCLDFWRNGDGWEAEVQNTHGMESNRYATLTDWADALIAAQTTQAEDAAL